MPLIKDFYIIESIHHTNAFQLYADVLINKENPIFQGHFPNHPVTPGVCMLQIIKELGEDWAGSALLLKMARNMKFLAIINPFENEKIRVELYFENKEDGQLFIKSTTSFGETIALKFNGVFQRIDK